MVRRHVSVGAACIVVLSSAVSVVECTQPGPHRTMEFEGKTWACDPSARVTVEKYGRKTALHVSGPQSTASVFLPAVEFQDGTIEVDIAAPQRASPEIGFRGRRDGRWANRIVFNRWASNDESKHDVIEQALVTRRASRVLLLNIRKAARNGGQGPVEADDWFHVKVVVQAATVKVFLNGSKKPDLEVGAVFDKDEKGVLGLCGGDCYFANFRYTPAKRSNGGDRSSVTEVRPEKKMKVE